MKKPLRTDWLVGDSASPELVAKIKGQYPDAILLFRCGDFYESYDVDADVVCKVCNLILSARIQIN